MSKTYRGTAIAKVVGASVTDDGSQVMMGLESVAGEDLMFLMPAQEAQKLMLLAAQCSGEAQRKTMGEGGRTALEVARWSIATDESTGQVVLMLTIAGGTELVFRLPQRERLAVVKALTEAHGHESGETDPSKLN